MRAGILFTVHPQDRHAHPEWLKGPSQVGRGFLGGASGSPGSPRKPGEGPGRLAQKAGRLPEVVTQQLQGGRSRRCLCPEGEGSGSRVFCGDRIRTPRVPGPWLWLCAGWWLVGGQGLGGLLDLAPESKLLPAGLDQLRPDTWVLPFLYLQTQSMAGPVAGSLLKALWTWCLSPSRSVQVTQKLQEPPPARPAPLNCSPQADTAIFPGSRLPRMPKPSMSSNCSEDKAQPPSHPSLCGLCGSALCSLTPVSFNPWLFPLPGKIFLPLSAQFVLSETSLLPENLLRPLVRTHSLCYTLPWCHICLQGPYEVVI